MLIKDDSARQKADDAGARLGAMKRWRMGSSEVQLMRHKALEVLCNPPHASNSCEYGLHRSQPRGLQPRLVCEERGNAVTL